MLLHAVIYKKKADTFELITVEIAHCTVCDG
jgi:hypothetical protein